MKYTNTTEYTNYEWTRADFNPVINKFKNYNF